MPNGFHIFIAILAMSVDSLLAGTTVAPFLHSPRSRISFALACGLCDGTASVLGIFLPETSVGLPDWLIYMACVALLLWSLRTTRAWLFGIPILLSFDNLVAGTAVQDAGVLAFGSLLMATAGIILGSIGIRSAHWILPERSVG